jgi:hypothetical protein
MEITLPSKIVALSRDVIRQTIIFSVEKCFSPQDKIIFSNNDCSDHFDAQKSSIIQSFGDPSEVKPNPIN